MGPGGADREAALRGHLLHHPPQRAQLGARLDRVRGTGVVAISQTDSISSGLTSPSARTPSRSSRSPSIELERSSVSSSTIMSSSSIPRVYEGPVNRCSTGQS